MNIELFMKNLSSRDIEIKAEKDKIILSGSKNLITPELVQQIKEQKTAILAWVNANCVNEQKDREKSYPLSFLQKRLWFMEQMQPGSALYNVAIPLKLKGTFDINLLQQSMNILVDRQKVFKTLYFQKDAELFQRIDENAQVELIVKDLRTVAAEQKEDQCDQIIQEAINKPFDLQSAPMLTCTYIRLREEEQIFLAVSNHFAMDGWSIGLFCNELAVIYESLKTGMEILLPPIMMQYVDYVLSERQQLEEVWINKQGNYWLEKLKGAEFVLNLPIDKSRPPIQTYCGDRFYFTVEQEQYDKLNSLGKDMHMTMFMILLSAFQILLHFYTRQNSIIIATAISNRGKTEVENLIGPFSNNLLLRGEFKDDHETVETFLNQMKEVVIGAFVNKDLPFEWLVEKLNPVRDFSRNPLFQVMFTLQNAHRVSKGQDYLSLEQIEIESHLAKFDLTLELVDEGGQISGWLEYNTDLFEPDTISRMVEYYRIILESMVIQKQQKIDIFLQRLMTEKQMMLNILNDTQVDYPSMCIHELFEIQSDATPDTVALISGNKVVTYYELDRYASQISQYILYKGAKAGEHIGICMERNSDMVAVILGILKAGCIYVPIDVNYPKDRIKFMVEDSGAAIIITDQQSDVGGSATTIFLCQEQEQILTMDGTRHINTTGSERAAYLIYTSGSTGTPKGVIGTHKGMVNRLNWMWRIYPYDEGEVCCQKSAISFVDSISEIFCPLLKGIPLVFIPQDILLDIDRFLDYILKYRISRLVLVPTLLRAILWHERAEAGLRHVKLCVTSGEALPVEVLEMFHKKCKNTKLLNLYGSSEVSADVTCYEFQGEICNPVPIGRPIDNTEIYILDKRYSPVPIGVIGEIFIAGEGLALGYHNRKELMEEKFISNGIHPDRYPLMFRSGDMGRFIKNGMIEYHGRRDGQLKIRGIRVEVEEIRNVIMKLPYVYHAAVVNCATDMEDVWLKAYVVLEEKYRNQVPNLREDLKKSVPDYMIPIDFIYVDQISLLPNGKVDLDMLPIQSTAVKTATPCGQRLNPVTEMVLGIFKNVIKSDRITALDDFFEVGGHSLLMTQVISRIRKEFEIDVNIQEFFVHRSAESLAQIVLQKWQSSDKNVNEEIKMVDRSLPLTLSMAQKRLWFMHQLQPESNEYNIPIVLRIEGDLDLNVLRMSFTAIVERHEVMRTRYPMENGMPVVVVDDAAVIIDTADFKLQPKQAMSYIEKQAELPFEIGEEPLYRVSLANTGEKSYILLICLHHIISDGWSRNILLRELLQFYEHFRSGGKRIMLEDLSIQYFDYAAWQNRQYERNHMDKQMEYWNQKLNNLAEPLDFSVFGREQNGTMTESNIIKLELNSKLSLSLKKLAREEGCTLFMVLLSIYQLLLYLYTGQHEICVGSPIAGRIRKETEDLIGFFVNTLVFKGLIDPELNYQDYLKQVKKDALESYEHQDIPFDKIVEMVNPERMTDRNPIFQVMFILQNMPMDVLKSEELSFIPVQLANKAVKFDLTLELVDDGDGISGWFEYNTALFDKKVMEQLVKHFQNLIENIIEERNTRIDSLQMLDEQELNQLLNLWNNTQVAYSNSSIHQLFDIQAQTTPQRLALSDESGDMTYYDLTQYANQVAQYLLDQGAEVGDRTAIYMERSSDMIAAMLGILKTGGIYVPVDVSSPKERTKFMIMDSESKYIITDRVDQVPENCGKAVIIDLPLYRDVVKQKKVKQISRAVPMDYTAYLIYTSGSTGKPKGVLGTHRGVVNRCNWMWEKYPYEKDEVCCQKTAISFVDAVSEIFTPLLKGIRLVIIPQHELLDINKFMNKLYRYQVSRLVLVPSLLKVIIEQEDVCNKLRHLKLCVTSGEELSVKLAVNFRKILSHVKLINLYGSSEVAADATYYEVNDEILSNIPIGVPVDNTKIYILDQNRRPVPIGIIGEIYVAGDGLSNGYFNREELTKERFVKNCLNAKTSSYMFKTGDLGRYQRDGNIVYAGRMDDQIKIRGMRVEIDEVKHTLLSLQDIKDAVVTPMKDISGGIKLAAYLVMADPDIDLVEIRRKLVPILPSYMIPSHFIPISHIPLLVSGKIDREKLMAITIPKEGNIKEEKLKTSLEKKIAAIWNELLHVEVLYRTDNFFFLGGHSLLATQLLSRLRDAYQVEIELKDFYDNPTVRNIGEVIEAKLLSAIKEDELEEMLIYINGLEEQQIKALLDERGS